MKKYYEIMYKPNHHKAEDTKGNQLKALLELLTDLD